MFTQADNEEPVKNIDVLDSSVNITLIDVNPKDRVSLLNLLKTNFYNRHKNILSKFCNSYIENSFFIPHVYYAFGNYDAIILSTTDNYTFSQKLLLPKFSDEENVQDIPNYSYQVITGIIRNTFHEFKISESYNKYSFINISNFKLNNERLISHGAKFIEDSLEQIKNELSIFKKDGNNFDYIIINSFSWFEFTIIFFFDDPQFVSKTASLRDLYSNQNHINDSSELENANIFIDSISYFGFNAEKLNNSSLSTDHIRLETLIEWQIKPGHTFLFHEYLKNREEVKQIFDLNNRKLLIGKSDHLISEIDNTRFDNNYKLLKFFIEESQNHRGSENTSIFSHISNIYTRVYFEGTDNEKETNTHTIDEIKLDHREKEFYRKLIHISKKIDISSIDKKLKALKISRQTKEMTLKILHTYQNGIKDEVLCIFFVDFVHFINAFVNRIDKFYTLYKKAIAGEIAELNYEYMSNEEIEDNIHKWVMNLDSSIKLRTLNSYRFEDITELNLDFNSSIQQIISMYNSIVNLYGNMLYKNNANYIVIINYKSTKSGINVVCYNVYDFLNPEFIFFSLAKELLNNIVEYLPEKEKNEYEKIIDASDEILHSDSERFFSYLHGLLEEGIIDVKYLINDALRFVITCNRHFDLFIYWTWATTLKNSSVYDFSGTVSKKEFTGVLFRIMFTVCVHKSIVTETRDEAIKKISEFLDNNMYCPIPELESLWNTIYPKIKKEIAEIFTDEGTLFYKNIIEPIRELVNKILRIMYIDIYVNEDDDPESKKYDVITYREMVLNDEIKSAQLIKEKNINIQLEALMLECLTTIINKNYKKGEYLNYLHRNWIDGKPLLKLNQFPNTNSNIFYKIDQTGNVFYLNNKNAMKYFKYRNKILLTLSTISMTYKSNVINHNHA